MDKKDNKYNEMKLEEVMTELDKVMAELESGDVSLEESFELYKEGMIMMKACSDKLDAVEKKLIILEEEE